METDGEGVAETSTELPPTPEQTPVQSPAKSPPLAESPTKSPPLAESPAMSPPLAQSPTKSPSLAESPSKSPVSQESPGDNDQAGDPSNAIPSKEPPTPLAAVGTPPASVSAEVVTATDAAKPSPSGPTSAGKKKRKDTPCESGTHRVTFTVTISKAMPTVEDDESADGYDSKRRRRIVEAPRAQNYFHCEYSLLPDDEEIVRTDVVTFGVAAKIYTERQDPKVLKTWADGDLTWVAWTHAHTVTITDELLTKLFTHELQLRVWDTRDKLSTRARYDRPKAFKLPSTKAGEDAEGGGVKPLVMKQVLSFESLQPKKSYIDRPLPAQAGFQSKMNAALDKLAGPVLAEPGDITDRVAEYVQSSSQMCSAKPQSPTPTTLVQVPASLAGDTKSYSRLGRLAGVVPPIDHSNQASATHLRQMQTKIKSEAKLTHRPRVPSGGKTVDSNIAGQSEVVQGETDHKGSAGSQRPGVPGQEVQKPRRSKKQEAAAQARAEQIKKFGICSITIQMAKLFAGLDTVTERLDKSISGLEDMFITVSISGTLMSEQQHRKLNPLVVNLSAAIDMPDTPLSYDELRLRCEPAYVKYQMFDMPEHKSVGREQDKNIYWNDTHVVLAGIIEPPRLREFLNGPPVEIEVHDRDRIQEKQKLKPTLFGDDLEDEKISNVGTISKEVIRSAEDNEDGLDVIYLDDDIILDDNNPRKMCKRTVHNPFTGKDQPWDPYGISKLDMSGLLLGEKLIHINIPIHQCDTPDVLGVREYRQDGKLIGVAGAVDGPVSSPLLPGHYLQSAAYLKVKVEVAYPLITPGQLAANVVMEHTAQCPFSRIVYKFDYKNITFLTQLQSLITEINAASLGLGEMPPHVIKAALSTYKLSFEQQNNGDLDIVTGFQVLDGDMHLFVLEGITNGGISRLWKTLEQPANSDVHVLYHSDMVFSERLYGSLDVDLSRIKLHATLSAITRQPLLYVRDMVPKPCFQALVKLDQLSRMTKLRAVIRSNLFPTADMVVSMSKEFGVPMTAEDFEELVLPPSKLDVLDDTNKDEMPHTSRVWTPIDNYNTAYVDKIQDRDHMDTAIDYTKENMAMVRERSLWNSIERSKTVPQTIRVQTETAHNYSTMACNSMEQAKEALRKTLAEKPDVRYTYCPDYHNSMTVVPVNVDALKKSEQKASHSAWKTQAGFIYPGKKTMIESNVHPRRLHPARAEDLQQPWEELSRLPKGVTVPRRCYTWNKRNQDMDTWTRPLPVFGTNEPVTIHLAGEKLRQEFLQRAQKEKTMWHSKVIVNNTRSYFHRCATETELKDSGFKSSNQIARLQGLTKDPPVKYSLRKPGLALKDIPPLNVVRNPSVDAEARLAGLDTGPAIKDEFDKKIKGFVPGNNNNGSIIVDKNQIPVRDYEHKTFIEARGQDFNVYHKERSNLHKQHIVPMTEEEYRAHIFYIPPDTLPRHYTLPDVDSFNRQFTKASVNSGFVSLSGNKEQTQTSVEMN